MNQDDGDAAGGWPATPLEDDDNKKRKKFFIVLAKDTRARISSFWMEINPDG